MNAEQWNAWYPIGTRVMAYPSVRPEDPLAVAYQERAAAGRLLGDGTPTRAEGWTPSRGPSPGRSGTARRLSWSRARRAASCSTTST